MKIAEVFLLEAYFDDLQVAVMDRLAQADGEDESNISTEQFRQALASDGFLLSVDELKKALTQMDVVANIDDNNITPKGKIDNDDVADPEMDMGPDVAQMAGDQALGAVKDQLPQRVPRLFDPGPATNIVSSLLSGKTLF